VAHERQSAMLKSFWADETAQGLTEYALIIAIVAVGLLLAMIALREQLGTVFVAIKEEIAEQLRKRPGEGQGQGCPSIHGCREVRLKAKP
jgi:Flp pilus assembly pilin Flp